MWELDCEEAEHRRIDAFELGCWRRLLRIPWTARRSNQSTLKEISPECSLEGLMLKLQLQSSGHLMRRTDSLMLGKIEGRRRRGWQRMRGLDGITNSIDMSLSKLWELVMDRKSLVCCSPWVCKKWDTTESLNWTEWYMSREERVRGEFQSCYQSNSQMTKHLFTEWVKPWEEKY